jgi:hypothetical protein
MHFSFNVLTLAAVVAGVAGSGTGSRAVAASTGIETTPIPAPTKPNFSKMMIGKWTLADTT